MRIQRERAPKLDAIVWRNSVDIKTIIKFLLDQINKVATAKKSMAVSVGDASANSELSGFLTYHVIGIFSVKSSAVKLPSVVSNKTFVAMVKELYGMLQSNSSEY